MDARYTSESVTDDCLRLIVRPNRTLTLRGMALLFAVQAAVVLTIGTGFALAGAWPVLPFAGLEMAVVGAVLYRLYRHADDHDLILIHRDSVTVTRRKGSRVWRDEFQRYWIRTMLERRQGWYPSRLKMGSHGKYVVVAEDVNEAERESLSKSLGNILRKAD